MMLAAMSTEVLPEWSSAAAAALGIFFSAREISETVKALQSLKSRWLISGFPTQCGIGVHVILAVSDIW